MEKIYVVHSSSFDFKQELYVPIRNSKLNTLYEVLLPHENSREPFNSKEEIKNCKVMIAEVSYPSTGLGIELGWADLYEIPIIFTYKEGSKLSSSLKVVSSNFIEYASVEKLFFDIEKVMENILN